MKEYYRVDYSEQESGKEATKHTTCIARNPHVWLACRRQFESAKPSHQPIIKIVIIGDKNISKEEYDVYHAAETKRMLAAMDV